jgi:hypothetical protein
MLRQAAFGEIEGGEEFSAALLAPDRIQPPFGGMPLRTIREPVD